MGSFSVDTNAMVVAAGKVMSAVTDVDGAKRAASLAAGDEGAFGSEQIGEAFHSMAGRAVVATAEISQTMETLANNIFAASQGYLITNLGALKMLELERHGFKP